MDNKKTPQNQNIAFKREVRCPVHNCLIGKYDVRYGVINVTFFCHKCGREYDFTIKREKISTDSDKLLKNS